MTKNKNNFKSFFIRNIHIDLINKMKAEKEKDNSMSFSRQIRTALKFWFDNKE